MQNADNVNVSKKNGNLNGKDLEENYVVSMNTIVNSLLNLYQRYINNDMISDAVKKEFVQHVYCNKTYFHNPNYRYYLKSNIIGTIETNTKGIYLFHSILKNANLSNILQIIVNNEKFNQEMNVWLMLDGNDQIPIECIVFGGYNEKYQALKYSKESLEEYIDVQEKNLLELLHTMQRETINVKLNSIV